MTQEKLKQIRRMLREQLLVASSFGLALNSVLLYYLFTGERNPIFVGLTVLSITFFTFLITTIGHRLRFINDYID